VLLLLVKWIKCKVNVEKKTAFSTAQEQWKLVKGTKGFLGQIGGWNSLDPLESCILSIWESEESYKEFMTHVHDQIFQNSQQQGTYEQISVSLYAKIDTLGPADFFQNGQFLQVVENFPFKKKLPVLEQGMLSGMVCRHQAQTEQYLYASLWNHDFKELGIQVKLNEAWTVL
jgi:heme-degrading monooxygenase HmoA